MKCCRREKYIKDKMILKQKHEEEITEDVEGPFGDGDVTAHSSSDGDVAAHSSMHMDPSFDETAELLENI